MMEATIQWALARLLKASDDKFYGSVTITFQNGKAHTIRVEESEVYRAP